MIFEKIIILFIFVVKTTSSSIGMDTEDLTTCSKYHFEEMVLEKLVRIEHSMELFKEKMKTWEESITSKMKSLEKSEIQRENTLETFHGMVVRKQQMLNDTLSQEISKKMETLDSNYDISNKSLTFLKQSVSEFVKSQKFVLSQAFRNLQQNGSVLSDNLRINKEQIRKELRDELKTPTVLFNARHLGFDTNMKGKTLVFTEILLNKGGGYNKGNGIFTAPVDGTYIFNMQVCPEDGDFVSLRMMADSKVITMLSFKNALGKNGPCVSANGVAVLSKGSKVWIMCYDTNIAGDVLYNDSGDNNGNYFSGVLTHTGTD